MSIRFAKGHGTENDFVLVHVDEIGELTADVVRALCDRHAGIGADGVLGVAVTDPGWFMDYRNADGSVAEMCGNGIRVFGRYLVDTAMSDPGAIDIETRAGRRRVDVPPTGDVTVDMGAPVFLDAEPTVGGRPATAVSMGNPHVVLTLGSETELAGLDLGRAPVVGPALPGGQNVEYVVRTGPRSIAMRVHERGSGETRSCGTGICAAVVATIGDGPDAAGRAEPWQVEVTGGRLTVRWTAGGAVLLTGAAVIVARGTLDERWLAPVR